jgi:hypothetical protein
MEITLTTPSLLFPAISLLLLAYTNRFLGLATVIRELHGNFKTSPDPVYRGQIQNLRTRIRLIKDMQFFGVLSLLLCTVCMFVLFQGWENAGRICFQISLLLMIVSLSLSLWEIYLSVGALNLHLQDLEDQDKNA